MIGFGRLLCRLAGLMGLLRWRYSVAERGVRVFNCCMKLPDAESDFCMTCAAGPRKQRSRPGLVDITLCGLGW